MVPVTSERFLVSVLGLILLCSVIQAATPAAGDYDGDCLASDKCNGNDLTCRNKKCECVAGKVFNPSAKKCEDIAAGAFGGDCLASDKCNSVDLTCNNKKCECVAGKAFTPSTKKCEDIAAGDMGGDCLKDDKCNNGLTCKNSKCGCGDGKTFDRKTSQCVDTSVGGIGDDCNAQKKCDTEFTCDNGKCGCQKDKMYNPKTKKCEDIPDGAFGGSCKASDVCDGSLKCTSGKCLCEAGKNYDWTTKQCTDAGGFGDDCSALKKCDDEFTCDNGKCRCQKDKMYNSKTQKCEDIPDGAFGGNCKASDVCDSGFICTSGKCLCGAGKYYCYTSLQCKDKKEYGEECSATKKCIDELTCKNEKCGCQMFKMYNSKTKKCEDIPDGAFGGNCKASDVCDSGFICTSGKCLCGAGKYYCYTSLQCKDKKEYGEECSATKKCIDELTCKNEKCGCQMFKMYNSQTKKCEDIPEGAFGGKCKAGDVCDGQLACTSGKCVCGLGKYYDWTAKQCKVLVGIGGDCSDVIKCAYSLVCKDKKCACESDRAYDTKTKLCLKCKPACSATQMCEEHNFSQEKAECITPPNSLGKDCSSDATVCTNGLQCLHKMCMCPAPTGHEIINGECKKLGPDNFLNKCKKNSDCKSLHCYSGVCVCQYGKKPNTQGQCVENTAQANLCTPKCTGNEVCTEDKMNKRYFCHVFPPGYYEDCEDDKDCPSGLNCGVHENRKVCICKHHMIKGKCTTFVFNKDEPADHGEDCSEDKGNERKCKENAGLKCDTKSGETRMQCMCEKGYYWDGETCEKQRALGQKCDEIDDRKDVCADFNMRCESNVCRFGKCECKDRSQYLEGGTCKPRKALKAACKADNECKQHAICKGDVCTCDDDKSHEKNGECEEKLGFMASDCDGKQCRKNLMCKTDDKTSKKRCKCDDNQYWNGEDDKCVGQQEGGKPCDRNEMCKSNRCENKKEGRMCTCSDDEKEYYDMEKKACVARKAINQECSMISLHRSECPKNAECTARHQSENKPICQCQLNYYLDGKECKRFPIRDFCLTPKSGQRSLYLKPGSKLEDLCSPFEIPAGMTGLKSSFKFGSAYHDRKDLKNILEDDKEQSAVPLTAGKWKLSSALLSTSPYCGPGVLQIGLAWKEGFDDKNIVLYRPARCDCDNAGKDVELLVENVDPSAEAELELGESDFEKVLSQVKKTDGPDVMISVQPGTKGSGLDENTHESPHHICVWATKRDRESTKCTKMPLRTSDDRTLWCNPDTRAIKSKVNYDVRNFHPVPDGRILCGEVYLIIQFDSEVIDKEDDDKTCNNFFKLPAKIKCDYKNVEEKSFRSFPTNGGQAHVASYQVGADLKQFKYNPKNHIWTELNDLDRRGVSVSQVLKAYRGKFSEPYQRGLICSMAEDLMVKDFFEGDDESSLPDKYHEAIDKLTSFSGEGIDMESLIKKITDDNGLYGALAGIMKAGECLFRPGSNRTATRKRVKEIVHSVLKEILPTLKVFPKLPNGVTEKDIEIHAQYVTALVMILSRLEGGGGYNMIARYAKQIIETMKNPTTTHGCNTNWYDILITMIENTLNCERVIDKYPQNKMELCDNIMTTYQMTVSHSWGRDIPAMDASKCSGLGSGNIGMHYPVRTYVKGNDFFSYSLDMSFYGMCGRQVGVFSCDASTQTCPSKPK